MSDSTIFISQHLEMDLTALPYHIKVRNHFFEQKKTWQFYASSKTKDEQLDRFKTELLKNTYKFTPGTDDNIYQKVSIVKQKLNLDALPVTVYQAQYTDELNASIVFLSNEAHIVFSGKVLQLLNDDELTAVLAHELTHIKLYSMMQGEMEVADRIITSIANNYNSEPSFLETARLFKLYTEIFCDRGAYIVLGNTDPVISSLVKLATGLEKVSAESYIKQADDILSSAGSFSGTEAISHPENFIRAKAINLWHNKQTEAEGEIIKMIEGKAKLDRLDIFKQKELTQLTRHFLQLYLKPKWFRTIQINALSKQYFTDCNFDDDIILTEQFSKTISEADMSIREYLAYVLLDFCLLDPTLEDIPFGRAFVFAQDLLLQETFDAVVKKELKFSDKKLQQHKEKLIAAYARVKEDEAEQVYE